MPRAQSGGSWTRSGSTTPSTRRTPETAGPAALLKNDRYDYPAGTDIGAPVTLRSVGSGFQHVPGVGTDYGIQVFAGTIVGYADADDIPFDDVPEVEINDTPIFSAGHHPDFDFCETTS